MSETQRFLLLSILIGVFAALLVVCFHVAIDVARWYTLDALSAASPLGRILSPVLGIGFAVFLVRRVFPQARGSGVIQTKGAVYMLDGYVPPSTIPGKFFACSISIGSGASLGPEDPALHMGAGVASWLGRVFHLGRDSMRLIAPVGAAAGIAAGFNTPITGVLFVMEEVLASWSAPVVGSILLSAVSSVVVTRAFLGDEPLFHVPAFRIAHPSELIVYAAMGVVGGVLSALFIKAIKRLRGALPEHSFYTQAIAAAALVGVIGLWLPQVMSAGYETIDGALNGRFPWRLLAILTIGKMLATILCFGARVPGGMFAPTLVTGAVLGGAVGGAAADFWPTPTGTLNAYVLAGIGVYFAGLFRAPMTAIFMAFEVSGSYVVILPVMIASVVSYFVSRRLHDEPFFTMVSRLEGTDLPSAEEHRTARPLRVEDAMRRGVDLILMPDTPPEDALRRMEEAGLDAAPVLLAPGQWSVATREALRDGGAAVSEPHPKLYPDQPADAALRLFGSYAALPVASRTEPKRLIGILTLADVHKAYGIRT